jgi:hypothetical protein
VNTTKGRLKIEAVNNIFFAINNADFTLEGMPLPVELAAFTAGTRATTVHLAWTTASEKNNAGFAVEASPDGSTFRKLGWVAAKSGSSSNPRHYSFDDGTLTAYMGPTTYYRLRQVDADGTEHFSPVRAVAVPLGLATRLQVWPTPTHGKVTVAGLAPGETVQVVDLTGRVLLTTALPAHGPLELVLPARLVPGVYVVHGGGQSRRLVVN